MSELLSSHARNRRRRRRLACAFVLAASMGGVAQASPANWLPTFHGPGVHDPHGPGEINAITSWGDHLVVGGNFTFAGPHRAQHIAAWDGASWHAFGAGFEGWFRSGPTRVRALAVYQGSLVAGGDFLHSGSTTLNGIGRWGGLEWRPFADGLPGAVWSLAVHEGALFAAGLVAESQEPYCVRWDGTAWQPLFERIVVAPQFGEKWGRPPRSRPAVHALVSYDGRLYMGGVFSHVDGVEVRNLAAWDGTHWLPVRGGVDGYVFAMHVYDEQLFVGGHFVEAGNTTLDAIARWDGSSWSRVGRREPWGHAFVYDFAEVDGELVAYAVPVFDASGSVTVWIWNGELWGRLPPLRDPVRGPQRIHNHRGRLILSGPWTVNGRLSAGLATLVGARWEPLTRSAGLASSTTGALSQGFSLPLSFAATIRAILPFRDELIVGGTIEWAGDGAVRSIGAWDGGAWRALGDGVEGTVYALAEFNGELIVGGSFERAGGIAARNIAAWDGSTWRNIGNVSPNGAGGGVSGLVVHDGKLIVVGGFHRAGTVSAYGLASWDGATWEKFDAGQLEYPGLVVRAGEQLIGGRGSPARWNGAQWVPLDPENGDPVLRDFTPYRNGVLGVPWQGNQLVHWDGERWRDFAGPFPFDGFNLGVHQGHVLLHGVQRDPQLPSSSSFRLVMWDGDRWASLGEHPNRFVLTYASVGDDLYLGGSFSTLGGLPVTGLAHWRSDLATTETLDPHLPVAMTLEVTSPVTSNRVSIWYSGATRQRVALDVYDARGRVVRSLHALPAWAEGTRRVTSWDGADVDGRRVGPGVYFVRFSSGERAVTRKVVMLR